MERAQLVMAQPKLTARFGKGVELSQSDKVWFENYALGFRRCIALKNLARVLAVAQHKGGLRLYAAYAPKPRLGEFESDESADLKKLIVDRGRSSGIDRPQDWAHDPMPLSDERLLHMSYTELVKLAMCHHMPRALQDLGAFYDQQFAPLDSYLLFGVFHTALKLKIDEADMANRLHRIDDVFSPFERVELERLSEDNKLFTNPKIAPLTELCS